jgi:hypothetical protein
MTFFAMRTYSTFIIMLLYSFLQSISRVSNICLLVDVTFGFWALVLVHDIRRWIQICITILHRCVFNKKIFQFFIIIINSSNYFLGTLDVIFYYVLQLCFLLPVLAGHLSFKIELNNGIFLVINICCKFTIDEIISQPIN